MRLLEEQEAKLTALRAALMKAKRGGASTPLTSSFIARNVDRNVRA